MSTRIQTPLLKRWRAHIMQWLYPKVIGIDKDLALASRTIAEPALLNIPTRHGDVKCYVYRPHSDAPLAKNPPVHVNFHGGAFIARFPEQDTNILNYIASEVGAVCINVDYDTAPQFHFPVAEEEAYDIVAWIANNGTKNGWDGSRISLSGTSAGGKLAISVAQIVFETKAFALRAIVSIYGLIDIHRMDRQAPAGKKTMVGPRLQKLMALNYFHDPATRTLPLASPIYDKDLVKKLPPALILAGDIDPVGPEMSDLAGKLKAAGVPVTYKCFENADHGFLHFKPVERVREGMILIRDHLLKYLK